MEKSKGLFKLPIIEDVNDYKKGTQIVIFTVCFLAINLVSLFYVKPYEYKIIEQIVLFIALTFIYRKVLLRDLKFFCRNLGKYLLFCIVFFIISIIFNILGGTLQNIIFSITGITQANVNNQNTVAGAFTQSPFLVGLIMVVMGPIIEELIYRRPFKKIFKNKALYFLISSLMFGIAHIIVGFSFPSSLILILPTFFAGLVYGFVYYKTNNIWCPILVHAMSNGIGIILTAVFS